MHRTKGSRHAGPRVRWPLPRRPPGRTNGHDQPSRIQSVRLQRRPCFLFGALVSRDGLRGIGNTERRRFSSTSSSRTFPAYETLESLIRLNFHRRKRVLFQPLASMERNSFGTDRRIRPMRADDCNYFKRAPECVRRLSLMRMPVVSYTLLRSFGRPHPDERHSFPTESADAELCRDRSVL